MPLVVDSSIPGSHQHAAATADPAEIIRRSENNTMLGTILIILLILMLLGALPTWGHSKSWGYGPTGGLGLVLIIVIVLVLTRTI